MLGSLTHVLLNGRQFFAQSSALSCTHVLYPELLRPFFPRSMPGLLKSQQTRSERAGQMAGDPYESLHLSASSEPSRSPALGERPQVMPTAFVISH